MRKNCNDRFECKSRKGILMLIIHGCKVCVVQKCTAGTAGKPGGRGWQYAGISLRCSHRDA